MSESRKWEVKKSKEEGRLGVGGRDFARQSVGELQREQKKRNEGGGEESVFIFLYMV